MNNDVASYIYSFEEPQREILVFLDGILTNEYSLEQKIRFKIPFYYRNSWICYLNPIKGEKIELAFLRGNELSNSNRLLSFKNRKQVAGIEFATIDKLDIAKIKEIIEEAILLDETIPYKSKRSKE